MYTKAKIFNLALGALLLQRQLIETETDKSNEAKVLSTHYDTAFRSTLGDLDLDSTSTSKTLELVEANPNDRWLFAYKYPSDCAFLRRIESAAVMDDRSTHIDKRIGMLNDQKVIFTNQENATVEYISHNVPLGSLSSEAGLAVAYRLAILSAPLITGKGAQKLKESIQAMYVIAKAEAKEQDKNENFNYVADEVSSEFVRARME